MPQSSPYASISMAQRVIATAAGLALAGLLVGAAEAPAPAAPLESLVLMHVDGTLTIEPDGRVGEVAIGTKFDDALRRALEAKMRGWRFTPVRIAGQPRRAETKFRVLLAARHWDGGVTVRIDDTSFGEVDQAVIAKGIVPDGTAAPITAVRRGPPQYPRDLLLGKKSGSVHLVMRISPDGRVADVIASQSLVFDYGGREKDAVARQSMRLFEASAIAAVRRWIFNVPGDASKRTVSEMTVSTEIEYSLGYDTEAAGQWVPVKRGPRRAVGWLPANQSGGSGAGMGATGQVAGAESPYRLETPVAGNVVM